jgi:nucleotide-binding universal stress UspA family protein
LAESVLPHVEELAKRRGTDLVNIVLLRVCEKPFITADYPESSMPLSWEEHVKLILDHFKQTSTQYLFNVENRLKDAGLNVESKVLMGDPANEIIKYADGHPFNLIVIATHGRSGLSRWAYGSVADKVLHGVMRPIFLVRPH